MQLALNMRIGMIFGVFLLFISRKFILRDSGPAHREHGEIAISLPFMHLMNIGALSPVSLAKQCDLLEKVQRAWKSYKLQVMKEMIYFVNKDRPLNKKQFSIM